LTTIEDGYFEYRRPMVPDDTFRRAVGTRIILGMAIMADIFLTCLT
jgi:hypothetical protein